MFFAVVQELNMHLLAVMIRFSALVLRSAPSLTSPSLLECVSLIRPPILTSARYCVSTLKSHDNDGMTEPNVEDAALKSFVIDASGTDILSTLNRLSSNFQNSVHSIFVTFIVSVSAPLKMNTEIGFVSHIAFFSQKKKKKELSAFFRKSTHP